jgi:thiol-disulfide isomerase/thioredoxin
MLYSGCAQNKLSIDEKSKKPMLMGTCSRADFADTSFAWWFNANYDMYEPDSALVASFATLFNYVRIKIVLGTWCSDSKTQVPRFLKILDKGRCPAERYEIICVNRKKEGLADEAKGLDIQLVPTFIIYQDTYEIGRIIETPKETLEKDLNKILIAMIKN